MTGGQSLECHLGGSMSISISLEKMSVEEKIQMMESLWDDLRSRAGDTLSPQWHGDELARREAALVSGDESSESWNSAKESIRKAVQ